RRDTDGQPLRDLPHGDCLVRCQEHPITQILGVWFAILPSHCSLRRCSKPEPYGSYPGGVSEPPISAWLGFRSGGKRSRYSMRAGSVGVSNGEDIGLVWPSPLSRSMSYK